MKTFLRIKQEASGYPNWVQTEDDKDKYIESYFQNEGIQLKKENIMKIRALNLYLSYF